MHLSLEGSADERAASIAATVSSFATTSSTPSTRGGRYGWGSYTIAGPGSARPYDPSASYMVKLEAYGDGTAIHHWKKASPNRASLEHVFLQNDWNVYNWRT